MRNQKGFTLIELMAVIVLATTVLVPMLSGLIGNYEVNARMHQRKAASSLTLTTIAAFEKVHFDNIDRALGTDNIVEITLEDCPSFDIDITNPNNYRYITSAEVCERIFNQEWNSIQFNGDGDFKVFFYPYHLDETQIAAISADTSLPPKVRNQIDSITPSADTDEEILRTTVWIEYDDKTGQTIIANGVINRD